MANVKLTTVIKQLEKGRLAYIKKFGVEPVIWTVDSEDDKTQISLTDKVKKEPGGYGRTTSAKKEMIVKTSLPGSF